MWLLRECERTSECWEGLERTGTSGLLVGAGSEAISRGLFPHWGLSGRGAALLVLTGASVVGLRFLLLLALILPPPVNAPLHTCILPFALPDLTSLPLCRLPHHIMSVDVQGGRIYVGDAQVSACEGGRGEAGQGRCVCAERTGLQEECMAGVIFTCHHATMRLHRQSQCPLISYHMSSVISDLTSPSCPPARNDITLLPPSFPLSRRSPSTLSPSSLPPSRRSPST